VANEVKPQRTGAMMPGRGAIYGGKPKDTKSTLKQVLKVLGKNRKMLVIVMIATVISTLCMLAGTYAIRPLINQIEAAINGTLSINSFFIWLPIFLIVLGAIYLLQVIMTWLQTQLMVRVSQKTVYQLRKDLFNHVLHLPVSFHDTHTHGELMSRFTNDIDLISEAITNSVSSLLNSTLTLVGTILMMIYLSPALAIITIVVLPCFSFIITKIVNQSKKYFRKQQAAIGDLNGFIEEAMEGQQVNQLFCHQTQVITQFDEFNERFRQVAVRAQSWSGMMIPLMMNLNSINYAIVAASGGYLAIAAGLSIGALGAFVNSTRQFARPLNEIAMQYTTIQAGLAAAERIFEIMKLLPEQENQSAVDITSAEGFVRFDNVVFGYVPTTQVLKKVTFYAKPGQKIAIVGSTGAGKTTITNLISRFYDIQEGSITLDGKDIREINRESLRKQMAMVLQDTHLFTGTVMENIRYGNLDANDEECIAAAKMANAHNFIMKLPNEYQTIITGDGNELSQGQRQLLNIARAAVANPKILILDEATSSIDTRTERSIEKGMDRLMEGRTTFVIAHRLSTVRHANAILVIENGQIIERGDHEDLLSQNGRYASLVLGQSELT